MTTADQTIALQAQEAAAAGAAVGNQTGPSGPDGKPMGLGAATRAMERAVEMTHAEALALKAAGGGGRRQILTDRGWCRVAPE